MADGPSDSGATDDIDGIWPGTLPAEQRAAWLAMTEEDRGKAARRLKAVLAYEASGRRDALGHAAMAGVGLPRFYKMMQAWGAEEALRSLVPQIRRRKARAFEVDPGVLEAATEMVRSMPDDSQERIAVALHERFGSPSLSWWRRLVARTRRDQSREAMGPFGTRLVVDSAAVPLPLLPDGTDEDAETDAEIRLDWAVVALVWDAASGLVLGHAVDRAPATVWLHVEAALAAVERLEGLEVVSGDEAGPRVVSTMPFDGDAVETMRIVARLSEIGLRGIHSPRAQGSELMTAFAGRIGTLDLNPRYAKDGFEARLPRSAALRRTGRVPMTLDDARTVVDVEISAHNDEVRASLPERLVVSGDAAAALRTLVATIRG